MRKNIVLVLAMTLLVSFHAYALDFKVFDMRNKIFDESKEIRTLLPKSKDALLIMSMFDSCVLVMSQLDAYFSMIGVFEAIPRKELTNTAFGLLSGWLKEIKNTSQIVIANLDPAAVQMEKATKAHAEKLRAYLAELNLRLDDEINKLSAIKKTLKTKPGK